jgi:hypothetical protein
MFDKESFTSLNQYFEQYVSYPSNFKRNVTYPGGWKKFLELMAQATMAPERMIEVLRVKISEHGQPVKLDVARSIDGTYDELCQKIFDIHRDRFFPAFINGKPIPSVIYIPIAGGQEWLSTIEQMPTEWFFEPSNFF